MSANRVRGGALVAALLVFAAVLVSVPRTRAILRTVAYQFGVLQKAPPLALGQSLGRIAVTALDGSDVTLPLRPGHPAIINVFATWCTPCQQESVAFARLAPKLARDGVDVIGVDQSENAAAVRRFSQAYDLRYPLYIDGDRTTATSLDARIIPTTILVDAKGIVKVIHTGPVVDEDLVAMRDIARSSR